RQEPAWETARHKIYGNPISACRYRSRSRKGETESNRMARRTIKYGERGGKPEFVLVSIVTCACKPSPRDLRRRIGCAPLAPGSAGEGLGRAARWRALHLVLQGAGEESG